MNLTSKTASRWGTLAIVGFSTLALPLVPFSAQAKDGDIIKRASCSRRAEIKLKASPENGRIEVEAEIDEATPGNRWNVVLKKNSSTLFRGTRTVNRAGNIEVRRVTSNGAGAERISAIARNLSTGERCRVALRVTF